MQTSKLYTRLTALLIAIMMLSSLSISADSIKVGADIGDAIATNIKVTINDKVIPAMVIKSDVAIEARYLASYGFDVNTDSKKKEIKISYNPNKKMTEVVQPAKAIVKPGKKIADVLKTDIKAYLNGKPIDCYSVKGNTVVLLKNFSTVGELKWNSGTRTFNLALKTPAAPNTNNNTDTNKNTNAGTSTNTSVNLSVQDIVSQNDDRICLIETKNIDGNGSLGSGILIKESLFLTNYHVIEDATSAKIKMMNGKVYDVQGVVVYDEKLDLAVVKINEKTNITPVTLGPLSEVKKGQHAVAIGSPLGLQNTVTEGIVSNLYNDDGRTLIQISVPVTHGSSGGALFNDKGQVIGVTTLAADDGALDINFAVPVDYINDWMKNVLAKDAATLSTTFPATTTGGSTKSIVASFSKTIIDGISQNQYNLKPTEAIFFINISNDEAAKAFRALPEITKKSLIRDYVMLNWKDVLGVQHAFTYVVYQNQALAYADLTYNMNASDVVIRYDMEIPKPIASSTASSTTMSLSQLQSNMENNYSSFTTSKGTFNLGAWYIEEEDGKIYIYANIDTLQYYKYLMNYKVISDEVMKWAESVGDALASYIPDKEVIFMVFYQDYYSTYPSSFDAKEVKYSSQTGKWLVTHSIISVTLDSEKINWATRP